MSERKNIFMTLGLSAAVSVIAVSLMSVFLTEYYRRAAFRAVEEITQKDLASYGYRPADILPFAAGYSALFGAAGVLAGIGLLLSFLLLWRRRGLVRLKELTEYLEKVNTGESGLLFQAGEDEFSKLQDELYKTVTALRQTKEEAVKARDSFAENLFNIAHQLKTPVTSISLSVQLMRELYAAGKLPAGHLEQIAQQLARLNRLEEALLLLSRIEAGTLSFQRRKIDVYTLLVLAAENLQELFTEAGVQAEIPESEEMLICVDPEWTMEALMNLFKNCMEHTPREGRVSCFFEQNPLYTRIRIWDNGEGFDREDLPYLFQRFYRGKNARGGGIGIGLSLAKVIIEGQNGMISAGNLPEGGAFFEIRFYSH